MCVNHPITAQRHSVCRHRTETEIVRLLLDSGCDPDCKSAKGRTALQSATVAVSFVRPLCVFSRSRCEREREGQS